MLSKSERLQSQAWVENQPLMFHRYQEIPKQELSPQLKTVLPAVPVLDARVVDDAENPSLSVAPIIEAKPMEETESAVTHHLKALLQNRKCQLVLTLTVALCIGGIIAAVLLTQNGSKQEQVTNWLLKVTTKLLADIFMAELKPLLSNESSTALNNPASPQSLSLAWLLEKSNFQDWPFASTSPAICHGNDLLCHRWTVMVQ
jgi:hypothetical protein